MGAAATEPRHLLLPADIETMDQLPGVDKVVKDAKRVMQLQAQELDKSEAIDMAELYLGISRRIEEGPRHP